ncbi:MAG: hypothetical protein HY287_11495 [Planctomycetes bacterium]|nr:hypothetical protein [Planctomycetota bacterium]MBI3834944.1 hypothetical protein [Planctomycetota bacterium]
MLAVTNLEAIDTWNRDRRSLVLIKFPLYTRSGPPADYDYTYTLCSEGPYKCGTAKRFVSFAGLQIDYYQCKIHPEIWRRMDVVLPLWMPLVIFAALPGIRLIAFVTRVFRRTPPGSCKKCRYNLTGNVSGVCPECGTPVT